jgi:hypothetical protein
MNQIKSKNMEVLTWRPNKKNETKIQTVVENETNPNAYSHLTILQFMLYSIESIVWR